MRGRSLQTVAIALATVLIGGRMALAGTAGSDADTSAVAQPAPAAAPDAGPALPPDQINDSFLGDYFAHWFDRVRIAQDSQPHWMTPVVTVTPRLEQEFRYDFGFQHAGNGSDLTNYGLGKGLELIPTTTNEVIFNLPPYEQRTNVKPASGLGDTPFFLVKQRFLSANEDSGNYILTGFFSVQAPTGVAAFSNNAYVITPTIAGGKGWGPFDVQGTLGVAYPLAHEETIGTSVVTNVAFQYHVAQVLWPEFEVNTTYWSSGEREGKVQTFLTPGIIFGRFPILWRFKAIVGVGYQVAVTPSLNLKPLTPTYNHQVVLTTRMAF